MSPQTARVHAVVVEAVGSQPRHSEEVTTLPESSRNTYDSGSETRAETPASPTTTDDTLAAEVAQANWLDSRENIRG